VAIANAGILLFFRASERRTELAVPTAAGAGPTQIARQLLVENLLLLALGLVLAAPITLLTQKILAAYPLPFEVPLRLDVRWDLRVLGFALLLTGVAGFSSASCPRSALREGIFARPFEADREKPPPRAAGCVRSLLALK
jgi:ABC-type antimicrobial peptide transport system permease subunit